MNGTNISNENHAQVQTITNWSFIFELFYGPLEEGLGLPQVVKKYSKKCPKKYFHRKAMNKALKKVLKLKSNKKSTQYFAQKSEFTKRRTQKSAPSQKSELKKVYPLKKVNLRRAPKIEWNPKKVRLLKKVLKKVLFHKITFLTFIFEE